MNTTDIYRRAIKRTFANLYGLSPDEVDVCWGNDTITARCSDKTFTHEINDDNDTSLKFTSYTEDPITVRLTEYERRRLERATRIPTP
jgi:hypothetical protein